MPTSALRQLRKAIDGQRKTSFTYIALDDSQTQRQVHPLALTNFGPKWLLTAWCTSRNDFRDFRVDRISELNVTRDKFSPAGGQELSDYLKRYST